MAIREDILTAAARAFGKMGYERATLDDVARIVGIRKASLYHHIRSKEELLLALHERTTDEALTRTRYALEGLSSADERLATFLRVLMRLIADHPDESIVFLHEPLPKSRRWRDVIDKREAYEGILRRILVSGVESRAFRRVNVTIVALGILGMVNWTHRWFRPNAGMSAEEIADIFSELVLRGLRDPSAARGPNGALRGGTTPRSGTAGRRRQAERSA